VYNEGYDSAAAHGHLKIAEFLHENRNEGCKTQQAMDNTI
jgi:hypothetical protein